VQHAHQKAIIHRDLKPANILVVEVDGKPVPRIIDFGLAKATTPQDAGETLFTQLGHFVGTPGYMSPEQADSNMQDIDTRTDVYSLGVVLYVLLTGLQPFDQANKNRPLDELLRELREHEPPPQHQGWHGSGYLDLDRRSARHRAQTVGEPAARRS
jgi:serine/threonine protein kinase